MTSSIQMPIGQATRLPEDVHELAVRCLQALRDRFYGFNIVAVETAGADDSAIARVKTIFQSLDWTVSEHRFDAKDRRGRVQYNLPAKNNRGTELWFEAPLATGPGFNHFRSSCANEGFYPVCSATILKGRTEQRQQESATFPWPPVLVPGHLSESQCQLYLVCLSQLQNNYYGSNYVRVDLSKYDEADVKAVRSALLDLGWCHNPQYGFYTYGDPFSQRQLVPWQSKGRYLGRPQQMLALACK